MVIFVDGKSQTPLNIDDWKIHFLLGPASMVVSGSVFKLDALGQGQKTALVGNSFDFFRNLESLLQRVECLREYCVFYTDFCTAFF